jgi:hypothetical protein
MLGTDSRYIAECKKLISVLDEKEFSEVNDVAYLQNGKLFVHLTHPSPGNGHIKNWFLGSGKIGEKKITAIDAIRSFG